MGTLTNDVSSSFPTPPPNAASMNPQAMASLQQAQALARGPFGQAYNFAVMTGVNASISCVMKRIRGKEDVQSSSGTPQLLTTGFKLDSGQSIKIPAFPRWSGRIWPRIGLECDGVGAAPPAFLFEITIGISADERDFYDVSIVDRYNLPLIASPPDVFQTSTQVVDRDNGGVGVVGYRSACEFRKGLISRRNGTYLKVPTGTTSSRKKRKPQKFWKNREEVFLITTMKDVTASNPKWKLDNNQFRAGFYNECKKKILSAFPGTDLRATPHINSKIKLCRKQYNTLQDMLKISGFGWDDEQKMALVDSDDVWLNYVRRVPDAKGMRNRPFPFYEDWLILFGKDRATGELAEDPADAVAAMEKEDANATTEGEYNISNRADSTKTRKKVARHTERIPTDLSEMAKNLGSFIENTNTTMVEIAHRIGHSHDLSQQRRLVNEKLLKLPMSTTQRLMAASMIVKDEDKVDLFFSLDENDKIEWVSLLLEGHI
ncbi:unnamed protein product [Camellia sinensis]